MKKQLTIILALAFTCGLGATAAPAQTGGNYTITQSVIGSGGTTSADAGNIYKVEGTIGQSVAGTASTNSPYSVYGGFWTPSPFAPTAAVASVGGRVLTTGGRGIRNVRVTLTDGSGSIRTILSSSFGNFSFENVLVGEVYILSVQAKQYQFNQNTQTVSVTENISDISFVANPQ